MRRSAIALLSSLGLLSASDTGAQPAGGAAGLKVAMSIERAGTGSGPLSAGDVLSVSIAFSDPDTGRPSPGLAPRAFIRRLAPGVASCGEAAHMLRATGVLGRNDFPLDGRYLVSLNQEGGSNRVSVTDLAHRLGVANTISVTPLAGPIDGMTVDAKAALALVISRAAGRVDAVSLPAGGVRSFASGLAEPGELLVLGDGSLVVGEDGTGTIALLGPGGRRLRTLAQGPGPLRLVATGGEGLIVRDASGASAFLRSPTADLVSLGALSDVLDADGGMLVSAGVDRHLDVRWLDAPSEKTSIALPFEPDGVALQVAGGRTFAIAWSSEDHPVVAVVDLALAKLAGTVTLPMPVRETTSAGNALVLSHPGGSMLSVLDLGAVPGGGSPFLRRIDLPASPPDVDDTWDGSSPGRLISLKPEPMALFVPGGSDRGYRIAAGGGLTNAPMGSTRIQGGSIRSIAMLDRGLAETEPGRFSAMVSLPRGGAFQVVATTGPGGTTGCAGFRLEGPGANEPLPSALSILRIDPPVVPGQATRLLLAVRNPPATLRKDPLLLRLHSLSFGAPRQVSAVLRQDGNFDLDLHEARLGRFALSVDDTASRIAPAVFDVTRSTSP